MLIGTSKQSQTYYRKSKKGTEHSYTRTKTFVNLACDNCQTEFVREQSKMDPKRLSNQYFHVCPNCDNKRFAQEKGLERRRLWSLTADKDLDISQL